MDLATVHAVVYETLQQATSQNPDVLKPAEQKLKEWEIVPGFYSILLDTFSTYTVDINVRWLAVICIKNSIDRYWREGAPNGITEEEKARIRLSVISNFKEPINQIATQLAVLIAKIARFDCPRRWTELIPTLLRMMDSEDPLEQHRVLLSLYHVIKTLSSKRLPGDRNLFQELTLNIFTFLHNKWDTYTCLAIGQIRNEGSDNAAEINKALENAMLTLRTLTKMAVHGIKYPQKCQEAICFINLIFERIRTMLEIRRSTKGALTTQVEKYIVKLTKVLISMLEFHPLSFVNFLPPTLTLTVHYAFTPEGAPLLFERFLIQCLNLLRGILLCPEFKPPKRIEYTKDPETLRAHQIKADFFTEDILNMMCRKLVTHFFLLTPVDLQQWDADPEGFVADEGGESWKYNLRPCTETLFLGLFHDFPETLTPLLLQLVEENNFRTQLADPNNLTAILAKDAVYHAVGLATFDLYDEVNFDEWFTTLLQRELQVKGDNYRIIRRRVVTLLGQWTGVKLSPELRPALYAAMLPLLQPGEDTAIRLAVCTTMRKVIADFEFSTDQFLDYLDPFFNLLFLLLKEVHECDTKIHVLRVLSFVVERVGISIRPHADSLMQYLPVLWQDSGDHNMLRCAVVSTLVQLVKALRNLSETSEMYLFILSVIQMSTDKEQSCHVYLIEDGLELWQTVMHSSSRITEPLLRLYDNMVPLLDLQPPLCMCFSIVQAYVLLAPDEFLQVHGERVVSICLALLVDDELKNEGINMIMKEFEFMIRIIMIMKVFEFMIRTSPNRCLSLLQPVYTQLFKNVYYGRDTPIPMVMTMYLSLTARVLMISAEMFARVVFLLAQEMGETPECITGKMLDTWTSKMALVTQTLRRKLLALALCSLLTSQSSAVLERFGNILLCITEVLNDIVRTDEMGTKIDSLIWGGPDSSPRSEYDDVDFKTEHDLRREVLTASDPVCKLELQKYFRNQLLELQSQVGQQTFTQLVQSIDADTLQQVQEYVTL